MRCNGDKMSVILFLIVKNAGTQQHSCKPFLTSDKLGADPYFEFSSRIWHLRHPLCLALGPSLPCQTRDYYCLTSPKTQIDCAVLEIFQTSTSPQGSAHLAMRLQPGRDPATGSSLRFERPPPAERGSYMRLPARGTRGQPPPPPPAYNLMSCVGRSCVSEDPRDTRAGGSLRRGPWQP